MDLKHGLILSEEYNNYKYSKQSVKESMWT